jgi:hypothetical protein
MPEIDVCDEIIERFSTEINALMYSLSMGVEGHDAYRGMVGKIAGYRSAQDLVRELREMILKQAEL